MMDLRKIIQWSCLLASFFSIYPNLSYPNDIRIEVVGVQEEEKALTHNFVTFYQEAASFLKNCETSESKPECYLLINSNWNLAGEEASKVMSLNLPVSPTPTKKNVLELVSNKLKNSNPNDTLTLTLTSHGHMTKSENSCITLNGNESICAGDLAAIAKLKPAGVRFFINAEGCFSGAFVDLVGPEVCAAVRVDRRNAGISYGGFLWDQVQEKKFQGLNQFSGPMGDAYTEKPILASESIKSLMCRETRKQTYKNWPQDKSLMEAMKDEKPWEDDEEAINKIKKLPPEKNTRFFSAASLDIENDHYSLLKINSQSAGFLIFLKQAKNGFNCKKVGFSGELCQSLEIILSSNFANEMQQINQLTWALLQSKSSEFDKLKQKYKTKLKGLLEGTYGQAWRQVEACLFNVEQTITQEEVDYLKERRSESLPLFPRTFTQKDIEEAKSCEAGIHF